MQTEEGEVQMRTPVIRKGGIQMPDGYYMDCLGHFLGRGEKTWHVSAANCE